MDFVQPANPELDPCEAPQFAAPAEQLRAKTPDLSASQFMHPEDTLEAALRSVNPVAPQPAHLLHDSYSAPKPPVSLIEPQNQLMEETQRADDRLLAVFGFGVAALMTLLTVLLFTS